MERRKLANCNSVFSEDIMTEIFLWLPVKSLIRFKRLSKRWYFLISHKNSYFRLNYLSDRIVGSNDDFNPIMVGFFYQKPVYHHRRSSNRIYGAYDRVRFLPSTSTQFKKYNIQEGQGTTKTTRMGIEGIEIVQVEQGQEIFKKKDKKYSIIQGGETTTTTLGIDDNNINPFSSLDKSVDKFLSCCLDRDQDSAGVPKKIYIAGSSNGFLLLSLEGRSPETYYLLNPVTMEWATLPKPETIRLSVYVGFVCKGNYPSLDTVEYTIVRVSWLMQGKLLYQFFSSGDNQWREYSCSCEPLVEFTLSKKQNPVIVSTTNSDHDQGGGPGIVVYVLVTVDASAIAVFDLNKGDNNSLQIIETPGLDLGDHFLECPDYISEFDDGVIRYVRICCSTHFEFWDLNTTESNEWCLKHRVDLNPLIEGYPWRVGWHWPAAERQNNGKLVLYHIHAFHPMNPNLIFLTFFGRMVCYNVQTGTLEMVYDFCSQNMWDDYSHYVYQWPCWPPLL